MDILEFLAKNFYFILIALFFVARLFSNSGKKGKTPGRMPDFSGEMTPNSPPERSPEPRPVPQQSRPAPQQSRPAPQQERPDTVFRTQMRTEPGELDEFPGAHRIEESAGDRSRQSVGASSHQARTRTAARGASGHAAPAQIAGPGKGLAKEDLRTAFIWSEVLGPPKAKRPHRRS